MTMFIFLPCLWFAFFQNTDSEIMVQEEFRVDFVRLDLLVLDRSGKPITDLKAEDFIVKEGRKTIEVEFFEPVDYRTAFASVTPNASEENLPLVEKLAEEEARPQFIFGLDLESVRLVQMARAFTQLREALMNGAFPAQADYLLYSMESGTITDGFVTNLEDVITSLNQFEERLRDRYEQEIKGRVGSHGSQVRGAGRASTGPRDLAELESRIDLCLMGVEAGRADPESYREALSCVADEVDTFVEEEKLAVRRVIGELEALTLRFQEQSGLKTLFFISPGFSLFPGREAGPMAEALVRDVIRGETIFPFSSFSSAESMEDELRQITHACIRNRVVFHTFDIFGNVNASKASFGLNPGKRNSRAGGFYLSSLENYTAALTTMSRESGGFHSRAPSLKKSISKIIPRLSYQYLLGYSSPPGKPGKFRKIKIKCKRKGAKLHYRRGYFGKP